MSVTVNCTEKTITFGGKAYPCRIGRLGFVEGDMGREGDEKTPLGSYQLRFGLYRADRLPAPRSAINFRPLIPDDGWCDASDDPAYNRFVRLPYTASHEMLWRDDGAYDIILVMNHNDSPPLKAENGQGLGSAVFLHIAQPDDRETMGCVAVTPEVMAGLLGVISLGTKVHITA